MNLRKKFMGHAILMGLFIVVIVVGIFSGYIFQYKKYRDYSCEIKNLNSQIKNADKKIKKLKSNTQGDGNLEQLARKQLDMVKSNEIVYIDRGKN